MSLFKLPVKLRKIKATFTGIYTSNVGLQLSVGIAYP